MKLNLKRCFFSFVLIFAQAVFSNVNIGPFFEYDSDREFMAVRPFWSTTPQTEDIVWPLGTWHTNNDQFWYRFLFLIYGHEGSFNLFPLWFSETDRETQAFDWAIFPVYGSHPHMLFMDDIHFVLWPLYMNYSVKDVRSHVVLWPIFSWKDEPRSGFRNMQIHCLPSRLRCPELRSSAGCYIRRKHTHR